MVASLILRFVVLRSSPSGRDCCGSSHFPSVFWCVASFSSFWVVLLSPPPSSGLCCFPPPPPPLGGLAYSISLADGSAFSSSSFLTSCYLGMSSLGRNSDPFTGRALDAGPTLFHFPSLVNATCFRHHLCKFRMSWMGFKAMEIPNCCCATPTSPSKASTSCTALQKNLIKDIPSLAQGVAQHKHA